MQCGGLSSERAICCGEKHRITITKSSFPIISSPITLVWAITAKCQKDLIPYNKAKIPKISRAKTEA